MLHKTRGLVLNFIRYRETSIIVRIYTEDLGLQSYLINGVRSSAKGSAKIALYQPLTPLDMVVYQNDKTNLQRIREARCTEPYTSLPFSVKKNGLALFITELLSKSLKSDEPNPDLFRFLNSSIHTLDNLEGNYQNFHLQFMLKLTRFMGIAPPDAGAFLEEVMAFAAGASEGKTIIQNLMDAPYGTPMGLNIDGRRHLLQLIIRYYEQHVPGFGELKSLPVLQEIAG
jgi:DNA repair protein RecO (recombination protein O)